MKKKRTFVLTVLVFIFAGSIGLYIFRNQNTSLIKECPDEWIEDRMPTVEGNNTERQYFIFKGERKEIKSYDADWIKSNCSVKVQYVY